eukprot:33599-Rhodomonas_salina.1
MRVASLMLLCSWIGACTCLVVPLPAAKPAVTLRDISLPRVSDGEQINLGKALESTTGKTMLVLGTYAGDFNMI